MSEELYAGIVVDGDPTLVQHSVNVWCLWVSYAWMSMQSSCHNGEGSVAFTVHPLL